MAARTKIFISSVAQDDFTPLRKDVFAKLRELGHEPVMFEENFGPWPAHADPVKTCLEHVEQSDIFLLFLKNKAGTYMKKSERSVTHLEFLHARKHKKTILAFADSVIVTLYFQQVRKTIEDCAATYESDHKRPPRFGDMLDMLGANAAIPSFVDAYIWLFMHDLVQKGVYVESLTTGVGIDWAAYFSNLLRRGAMLLPEADMMDHNAKMVELYADFRALASELIPLVEIGGPREADKFLTLLQSKVKGGIISARFGDYTSEELGGVEPCSAVTLYRRQDRSMRLVGRSGKAAGRDVIGLDDPESYVATAYNEAGRMPLLFFREGKPLFYFCLPIGEFVITFHFPSDRTWEVPTFWLYNQEIINGIMEQNFMVMELVQLLIGGMSRE